MKSDKLKKLFGILIVTIIVFMCSMTVFAVDYDGDGIDDDIPSVEDVTEYVAPVETEPYYEPATELPTEYYEPETQTPTEYYEPETENVTATEYYYEPEPETDYQEQTQPKAYAGIYDYEPTVTENQAPTLAKTISTKTYSTNNMAGIVSWACVIVGVITVAIVIISTKAGGSKQTVKTSSVDIYSSRR
jgi:hypothetical protein